MATKAELKARVELDSRPFRRSLARLKGGVRKFGREVGPAFRSAGAGIATMAKQIAVAATALAGIGIGRNFQIEQLNVQFKTLLGSVDAADERMRQLRDFAASTPFQLDELAEANKLLESAGEGSLDILRTIGDAAAATNPKNFRDIARIMQKAFAISSGGGALGEVLIQLQERALLSKESFIALREESRKGISTPQSIALILKDLARFKGSMDDLSKTGSGKISTLKDKILDSLGTITKGFADASKDGIQVVIDKITELSKEGGTFEQWGQKISRTIEVTVAAFNSLSNGQRTALINMAKNSAIFLVAWKAGLVKPLIAVTAALVGRMVTMLGPKVLLGGLAATSAFLAGKGIGKALEEHLDLSGFILKVGAWGSGVIKMGLKIAKAFVDPFLNAGKVLGELFTTGAISEATKAAFLGSINLGDVGRDLQTFGDAVNAEIDDTVDRINGMKADPKGGFFGDAKDGITNEFKEATDLALAEGRKLAAKLSKSLGFDVAGEAAGAFLAALQNEAKKAEQKLRFTKVDIIFPDDMLAGADKAKKKVDEVRNAVRRLNGDFSLMGGGAVRSLSEGAQAAVGPVIEAAKARAARRNEELAKKRQAEGGKKLGAFVARHPQDIPNINPRPQLKTAIQKMASRAENTDFKVTPRVLLQILDVNKRQLKEAESEDAITPFQVTGWI